MKKLLLMAVLLLSTNATFAQKTGEDEQLKKMNDAALKLLGEEKYEQAVEAYTNYTAKLKSIKGESDTTYIEGLVFLGKAYFRAKRINKAVETAQKVVDLYGKHLSTNDKRYAWYLDNLSLYLASNNKSKEALACSKKALEIYENLYVHDRDMASILIHAAENSFLAEEKEAAIKYQLRALAIMKDLQGIHSEQYIEEAKYLAGYYSGNGQEDKAKSLNEEVEKLEKEKKEGYGDLPKLVKFETPEDCKKHTEDMLKCCRFYINHLFTAHDIDDAAKYIIAWTETSDQVTIPIGKVELELISSEKSRPYIYSYFAGYTLYALENNEIKTEEDLYETAVVVMLNHYISNKKLTGEVKVLEKYLSLYNKDKQKMFDLIRKNFPKDDTKDKKKKK